MADKKLYLLDAFALIFRAYYALIRNPRMTSTGKNTSTQFGFVNTLVHLLKTQNATHIAICFDTPEVGVRNETFPDYKANREEAPEDLKLAIPDIKRLIKAFNIPIIEAPGYEADDIIGTLSKKGADAGYEVYMVTSDKDLGQLVNDKVFMYKPPSRGGKYEKLGEKEVCEKWDIQNVSQVIDMIALMGDAVDNIPGIKGVGAKTAAKLLKEYGTVENVLDNAENIKGKMGEKVAAGREDAMISKQLGTIIMDVPCEFNEEDYKISDWNRDELVEIFSDLEFRTLGQRVLGEEFKVKPKEGEQTDLFGNASTSKGKSTPPKRIYDNSTEEIPTTFKTIENTKHDYKFLEKEADIKKLIADLGGYKEICFDTETTGLAPLLCELVGMSFSVKKGQAFYVPCPKEKKDCLSFLDQFASLFANKKITWIGQNLKYDYLVMKNYGYLLEGNVFDTMLAHYVIEPEGKRSMDVLAEQYLQYSPVSIETLLGKKGKNQKSMGDLPQESISDYAAEDADVTLQLKKKLLPLIKKKEVEKVFYEVENPLLKVLADMEYEGIRVDEKFLNEYSVELGKDAKEAEESVYEQAGVRFNLKSPKQLGEVLFDKLKLDEKAKKTKTGQYKTGEDILQKLAAKHKIVDDILTFRQLTKLKNTYVDTLPGMINPNTGRVHTNYAQAVAATGRLASNNPNLQNIPIRTDKGREIRKAFVPRDENHVLVSADYSQVELRIVAAISGDPNMCEAFKSGVDIHTATAAKVFAVDAKDVTKEQRYKAKSVNFGIIYGQGAFGLADNLGISRTEAKEIIDNYKKEFIGITKYMSDMVEFAQENGYVQTLMGRKRWLKDINSGNFTVRGFAERNAINSPIQGTAADMIKLAMIHVADKLPMDKYKSRMLLQVHDELIFDVHKDELDEMKKLVLSTMENAMPLPNDVPLVAEMGVGQNWLEAH
jgi:DNA polymerase-1